MLVTNWVEWTEERYGSKKETYAKRILRAAREEASRLKEEFGWQDFEVNISKTSVFLAFTYSGHLYTALIPATLVIRTQNVTAPLRSVAEQVYSTHAAMYKKEQG